MMRILIPILLLCFSSPILAIDSPEAMSRAEYDQLMQDISNWGRWGADDELGTLNLITEKTRKSAAKLVREGITVSLALDLNTVSDPLNANPFKHEVYVAEFSGHQIAGDR